AASESVSGVGPRASPSTVTCAPEGRDDTTSSAFAGGGGGAGAGGGATATTGGGAGGGSGRRTIAHASSAPTGIPASAPSPSRIGARRDARTGGGSGGVTGSAISTLEKLALASRRGPIDCSSDHSTK